LTVFTHRNAGAGAAVALLRGTVFGYFAFAAFCTVLSLLLVSASLGVAFLSALTCAVLVQLFSRRMLG
jgi:hypothetical protein